jgi:hypothetical protein
VDCIQGRHALGVLCGLSDDIGDDGFKFKIDTFVFKEPRDWFDDGLMKIKLDAVKWTGAIKSLVDIMRGMFYEPAKLSGAMTWPETEPV